MNRLVIVIRNVRVTYWKYVHDYIYQIRVLKLLFMLTVFRVILSQQMEYKSIFHNLYFIIYTITGVLFQYVYNHFHSPVLKHGYIDFAHRARVEETGVNFKIVLPAVKCVHYSVLTIVQ